MKNENRNGKPILKLRKQYRKEMEDSNLTLDEYLLMKKREKADKVNLDHVNGAAIHLDLKDTVELNKNVQNLGFERRFFTLTDAEFVVEQIEKWENENSVWEPIEMSEEERESTRQDFMRSGVCYDFKNLGVSVYSTWGFTQHSFNQGASHINYNPSSFYYNHLSKEFREIDDEDYFEI